MIKNIIKNCSENTHFSIDGKNVKTFEHFTSLAEELTKKTGNKHVIERVLDYTDSYNNEPRYHYSFDLIELINE